jgi:hypothetical protein
MSPSTTLLVPTAAAAAKHQPRLEQLEQLIERDRRRKLLLALPCAGAIGLAATAQLLWLPLLLAVALLGVRALRR